MIDAPVVLAPTDALRVITPIGHDGDGGGSHTLVRLGV
jgi:hypothetical protein